MAQALGSLVPPNGQPEAEPETAVATLDAPEPEATPEPVASTIEDRLAALEAKLLEKDGLIAVQAAKINQAEANAEELARSRTRLERLETKADEAKKAASEAKKAHEAALAEHIELERELLSGQQRLPFREEPAPAETRERTRVVTEPEDDSWKSVPLSNLGIPEELPRSLVERLAESNLTTVGELSAYLEPAPGSGWCNKLTDLPGIGEAKAEAINDALMEFWKTRSLDSAEVNAELAEGVAEAEAAKEAEYQASLAVYSEPSTNGEWEDSELDPDTDPLDGGDTDDEPEDD